MVVGQQQNNLLVVKKELKKELVVDVEIKKLNLFQC
jgi:hypothetical protein